MDTDFYVVVGFLAPVGYSEQNLGTDMGYHGASGKEVENYHIGSMPYSEEELFGNELVGVIFGSENVCGWECIDVDGIKTAIEEAENKLGEVKSAMKSVLPESDHGLINQAKVVVWMGTCY